MTDRKARKNNMLAAAAVLTTPETKPEDSAARTKPYRITVDLSPATYTALHRWLASAAVEVDTPKLTLSDAVRAMVEGTIGDTDATTVVLGILRKDQGT